MSTRSIDRMAVEVEGTGDALVMLHGLGGTSNVFAPQVPAMAARFRVVRPDLPGSGRSPLAPDVSIASLADRVLRLLDALSVQRAHLVGHSLGTIVCQHVAAQHPARVASLVLFGPLTAPPDSAREGLRERAQKARADGMADIADAIVQAATSSDTRQKQPVAAAFVRELLMRQEPEGYARLCEALAAAQPADLAQIRCRTLLVTGDEDVVAPPSVSRDIAQRIADARVVILSKCGHWTTLERAAEVNAELRDFHFGRR